LDPVDALGAGILRALVALRAGSIIGAAAFLEMAIASASMSEKLTGFLRIFFAGLAVFFGLLSAVSAVMFMVGHLRAPPHPPQPGRDRRR
jgi:hypothetical protein